MSGQPNEEDDEELVSVPEHLKIGAPDELEGGGYHQEKGHRDDVTSNPSRSYKADGDSILYKHTMVIHSVCVCSTVVM